MPLQTGYRKYGESGIEVSDWFPHMGAMADELSVLRGMWTIDNNHGAQLTFHTGRKITEGAYPTVGSWVSYGLGTLNRNLPEFVVLGNPSADCCGAAWTHGSSYLGPRHAGVRLKVDPKNPMSFVTPADKEMTGEEQRENFGLVGQLNRIAGIDYPDDQKLQARIQSYELAYEMQTAVPEVMNFGQEAPHVQKLYGLDQKDNQTIRRKVSRRPPAGRTGSALRPRFFTATPATPVPGIPIVTSGKITPAWRKKWISRSVR